MKKGKKYQDALKKYNKNQAYSVEQAIKLMPEVSTSKFVGSVEAHIKLNLTAAEARQPIKGTVSLPHSFGKEKRVLVFCDGADVDKALKAGADYAGLEDLMKKIQGGWFDFDIALATPAVMPKIAVLGRDLGTKGLMPSPKNGTIATDVEASVKEFKAGKVAFKSDKQGIVHINIGKVDTDADKVKANFLLIAKKVVDAMKRSPINALSSVTLAPTMGPSVKVDLSDLFTNL